MPGVRDLARFLGGSWELGREVRDADGHLLATVSGSAWFAPGDHLTPDQVSRPDAPGDEAPRDDGDAEAGAGLTYHETGSLVPAAGAAGESSVAALVPGGATTVRRSYLYVLTGPGRAEVHFDHGGFFHDLDLRSGSWRVAHECGEDTYVGEYVVTGPDGFTQRWDVTGPAKNYRIHTVLVRADPRLPG